ncbi:putative FKBP-type peptidyl-prolyl cis-trans isomerase [Anaerolineae bacterium]|nr:putative FKBP-type peptidyl-prolyl cis-trans isomerase [Anaerolineae bacterium]
MFRNRTSAVPALVLTVLLAGCQKDAGANPPAAAPAAAVEPKTDDEKTLYAMGIVMGRNLTSLGLSAAELDMLKVGMTDEALGKEKKVKLEEFGPKIQAFAQGRAGALAAKEKQVSESFLATAAAAKGAQKKPSGLIYTEVLAGTGASPTASDTVKVHYTGKLVDGTVFDSSVQRGQPAEFRVGGVIPCWQEGVQLMKKGGKAQLVCPSEIAYGDAGSPPQIKPGATLVFDVELLDITKGPVAPGAK